jgi:hypothetical protein
MSSKVHHGANVICSVKMWYLNPKQVITAKYHNAGMQDNNTEALVIVVQEEVKSVQNTIKLTLFSTMTTSLIQRSLRSNDGFMFCRKVLLIRVLLKLDVSNEAKEEERVEVPEKVTAALWFYMTTFKGYNRKDFWSQAPLMVLQFGFINGG